MNQTGTVVGSVLDQSGAVILIPKPVIVFKGKGNAKKVTVNEDGRFETTLPSGTYIVTTEIPGFYPFRRAPFRVIANESILINVVPSRRYLVQGTSVSSKHSADQAALRPNYEQLRVDSKSPLTGLIQFEDKQRIRGAVRYRFAMFSYDQLTIYADELYLNRKPLRLVTSGKLVIENGKQRIEAKEVTVSFKGGEPLVDVK